MLKGWSEVVRQAINDAFLNKKHARDLSKGREQKTRWALERRRYVCLWLYTEEEPELRAYGCVCVCVCVLTETLFDLSDTKYWFLPEWCVFKGLFSELEGV